MECPICKGSGKIAEPHSKQIGKIVDIKIMASLLKREGYSFRQIQKFLGYKSVGSIQDLLKNGFEPKKGARGGFFDLPDIEEMGKE